MGIMHPSSAEVPDAPVPKRIDYRAVARNVRP